MATTKVLYVYDPLCGWCFGFSGVIRRLWSEWKSSFDFDVISGGMIIGSREGMLDPKMTAYIVDTIPRLEEHTGVRFGESYKEQLLSGTLYQSSMKPSIALTVFKKYRPADAVAFAGALQQAQFVEGKSLQDDATYATLLPEFKIPEADFLAALQEPGSRQAAEQEFALAQQLGVTGFPALIAVQHEQYYLLARGYQPYESLAPVFDRLKQME